MSSYAFIFALNLCVEYIIALALLDVKFWRRIFVMSFILNLATHPLLWIVLPRMPGNYLFNLCMAELIVAGAEVSLSLLFFRSHFSRARVVLAVLAGNVATFLMTFVV